MTETLTPVRRQYLKIKHENPNTIVLFRLGDFYETFDEDAHITARELEIVLTSREMGKGIKVPMAGIPYHALDNYLARLIKRGYKVAICEQLTEPGKGLVQRDVVRIVTPGTVVEPALLESKKNNYLSALVSDGDQAGLAFVDITTGEFAATQLPLSRAMTELERIKPSELILPEGMEFSMNALNAAVSRLDIYSFDFETASQCLLAHFEAGTLDGFGLNGLPLAVRAAGAIIQYLRSTQKTVLAQVNRLGAYSVKDYMALDSQTQRNLELFQSSRTGSVGGSLLSVIDLTRTPMGGRLLRRWLGQPLLDIKTINLRLDSVAWFTDRALERGKTTVLLSEINDLERLINRVKTGIVQPREMVSLKRSLEAVPELRRVIGDCTGIEWLTESLKPCPEVVDLIKLAVEDEPGQLGDGGVIRPGFETELDTVRATSKNARQFLADLEKRERENTGIKSLKIGFNNVFGYFIEVSNSNLTQVPESYIRKQTLTNGERFFTPELKEYESLILNARERIEQMETAAFRRVCGQVAGWGDRILELAGAIAVLDVLTGLAEVAVRYRYVRPELTSGVEIHITQGRHPVVERGTSEGKFIPNDTLLANDGEQLIVLTGPNMSGKSTYLRQVALIVLMAQIGSFVPAGSAKICVVDRIFTRIGAGEDIAAGQSTFMVEMVETAGILNNATPRSLLILDEIGRGTSTYDGLSIARAVAEYIHNAPGLGAKTLFATHYHEMTELAGTLPRVRNYNVAVIEEAGKLVFLHRIIPGGADRSYGIHVAQLAGLPKPVINRARDVLAALEGSGAASPKRNKVVVKEPAQQMALFGSTSQVSDELARLDVNALTPLEAITKLYELQNKAKG